MNTKKVLLLNLGLFFLLASCGLQTPDMSTAQPPVDTTPLEKISANLASPAPLPSNTNTPSPTLSSTVTAVPTETPTPRPNPTRTVFPEQATAIAMKEQGDFQGAVIEMLGTNGGCELPCWWGITPGETSWQDAKSFLNRIGISIYSSEKRNENLIRHFSAFEFDTYPVFTLGTLFFFERDSMVSMILLDVDGMKAPKDLHESWFIYSPYQIMMTYGQPDRVWVDTVADTDTRKSNTLYDLWLVYEKLGFIIRYQGFLDKRGGEILTFCPTFETEEDIQWMKVAIQSPADTASLEEAVDVFLRGHQSIRIQEATGLSEAEFYQRFQQMDVSPCFDTPAVLWPDKY